MSRPFASSARALTRTSNAVSVPRRAIRFARRSSWAVFMTVKSALYRGRAICLFPKYAFLQAQTRLVVPSLPWHIRCRSTRRRTFEITDYVIHPLTTADELVLWEMLYQALRTSADAPPRNIVRQPAY